MVWWQFILTIITSTSVIEFLKFLITRRDKNKNCQFTQEDRKRANETANKVDKLEERTLSLERSEDRTQLVLLMSLDPDNIDAIITLANHYFRVLKGNMYMTSMFTDWAKRHNIDEQVIHEIIKK
jgi:uncharacterized lipoprotein